MYSHLQGLEVECTENSPLPNLRAREAVFARYSAHTQLKEQLKRAATTNKQKQRQDSQRTQSNAQINILVFKRHFFETNCSPKRPIHCTQKYKQIKLENRPNQLSKLHNSLAQKPNSPLLYLFIATSETKKQLHFQGSSMIDPFDT